MNLISYLATVAILLCVAEFSAAVKSQNFCDQDNCYSCIGHTCAKFCTGPECGQCLQGLDKCCQTGGCNLCYGQKCCTNTTCNNCIASCFADCSTELTCYSICFNKCSPLQVQNHTTTRTIHNLNRNVPFNVTTTINITNTVNNTNFIDAVVYANKTNNNTINFKDALPGYFNHSSFNNSTKQRFTQCCNVSHPLNCHYTGYNKICIARRHIECSPICKSHHVLIGPGNGTVRAIPLMAPPYMYYGNYDVIDCDKCYTCNESNKVEICSGKSECPRKCKTHIQMLRGNGNTQNPRNRQSPDHLLRSLERPRPSQVVSKKYPLNQNAIVLPLSEIHSTSRGRQDTNPAMTVLNPQQHYPNQGMVLDQVPYSSQRDSITNGYYSGYTIPQTTQNIGQLPYMYPYGTNQGVQYRYSGSYPANGPQVASNVPVGYSTYPVPWAGAQNQYQQVNSGYWIY